MIRHLTTATLALWAGAMPLAAQEVFSLPESCTAYATMQKRGCTVSHLFTCEGDPAQHQRRVDLTEEGIVYLGMIDHETQWIESHHMRAGRVERLQPGPEDPASFTELVDTGLDTFDFITADDQGFSTRFVGQDRLTGVEEVIDGVTLLQTEFQVVARDPATGDELWRTFGQEYINPEWRTFVSGLSTVVTPDDSYDRDYRPVTFAFPGEDGFLAARPIYDCGALMSRAPALPLLEGQS